MVNIKTGLITLLLLIIFSCSEINNGSIFTKNEIKDISNKISDMVNVCRKNPGLWGTRGQAYGNVWDYEGKLLPLYYFQKWGIKSLTGKDKDFILRLSEIEDTYLLKLSQMNADSAEKIKFELTDYYRSYHYNHFLYSFTYQRYFLLKKMGKKKEMDRLVKSLISYNSKRIWNKALNNDAIYIEILKSHYLLKKDKKILKLINERLKDVKNKVLNKDQAIYEIHEPEKTIFANTRIANACATIIYAVEDIKDNLSFMDFNVFNEFIDNYLNNTDVLEIAHWIRILHSYNGIDYMASTKIVEYIIDRYEDNNKKSDILNQILYLLWRYQYNDGSWYVYRCTLNTVKCLDLINTILIKGEPFIKKSSKDCGIEARDKASQWLEKNYRDYIDKYPILTTKGGMEKLLTKYELLCLLRIYNITKDETMLESISLACYLFVENFWKKTSSTIEEAARNESFKKRIPIELGSEWAFPYSEIFKLAYRAFKDKPERYLYQKCMENMYEQNSVSIIEAWYKVNENWSIMENEEDMCKLVNTIKIISNIKNVVQMDAKIKAIEASKNLIKIIEDKINKFKTTGKIVILNEILDDKMTVVGDTTGLCCYSIKYRTFKKVLDVLYSIYSLNEEMGLNDKYINESIVKIVRHLIEHFNEMEKEINNNPHYNGRYLCDFENRVEAVALLYKIAKHYNEFDNYTINLGKRMKEEILAEKAYKHPIYHGRELVYGIGGPMLYAILAE